MKPQVKLFALAVLFVSLSMPHTASPGRQGTPQNARPATTPAATAPAAASGVRRALLVGIGKYKLDGAASSFRDLNGPINDVTELAALLRQKNYNFREVKTLLDAQATRAAIVAEFERLCINESKRGDVCLFFYAGHGSQVMNSLTEEIDKKDETIVPVDAVRLVTKREQLKDLRDKELAALYNRAIEKKVILTVISDSCHSGSNSRGGIGDVRSREIDPAAFDIKDDSMRDQKKPDEREGGALVISAAQDFELAQERSYFDSVDRNAKPKTRGDFTRALLQVLYQTPADTVSAEELFEKVATLMKADGRSQNPVIAGPRERQRQTIFGGQTTASTGAARVPVIVNDEDKSITLQGGMAHGLTTGSELRREGETPAGADPVRVVVESADLSKSKVKVISGRADAIKTGDFFVQTRWAVASEPNLTVYIPPARLSESELLAATAELAKLKERPGVELVEDPTASVATHTIFYDGAEWKMKDAGNEIAALGARPDATAVGRHLRPSPAGKTQVFVSLPPTAKLRETIKLGAGTDKSAVEIAPAPEMANYILVGRARATEAGGPVRLQYAWILPAATESEADAPVSAAASNSSASARIKPLPLPPRTDFVPAGDDATSLGAAARELETLALKLGKVRAWLKLPEPGGGSTDAVFPYRLAVRDASTGAALKENEPLVEGKRYGLALVADPKDLQNNTRLLRRWVYVFGIDKKGASTLLFPHEAGVGNNLPSIAAVSPPAEIPLGPRELFEIGGDLGTETYVMIATDDRIPNPSVFQFEGVRSRQAARSGDSPLASLLEDTLAATRDSRVIAAPKSWSLHRMTFRSVRKP